MNCENCCEAFVGIYEGYYVSKDDKKMRVCSCCKNEYIMMGWIGIKVEEPDDDEGSTTNEDDDEEVNPYMEELIECRRCEIEKPRKNMYWNTIGSYTDVCEDCEQMVKLKMPKIAITTLNLCEYKLYDGFYVRNGFSLVQEKYCTETGLPIFVNKRANGKWGYCDNDGTDFYVEWKILI